MKTIPTALLGVTSSDKQRPAIQDIAVLPKSKAIVATNGRTMAIFPLEDGEVPLQEFRITKEIMAKAKAGKKGKAARTVEIDMAARKVEGIDGAEQEGNFPNWKQVIPDASKVGARIRLDAKLLLELSKALGGEDEHITLSILPDNTGTAGPIIVHKDEDDKLAPFGVIMPVRRESEKPGFPEAKAPEASTPTPKDPAPTPKPKATPKPKGSGGMPAVPSAPAAKEPVGVKAQRNEEHNGVELVFTGKPSDEIREQLKARKFRWNRRASLWYTRHSEESWIFAQDLAAQTPQAVS